MLCWTIRCCVSRDPRWNRLSHMWQQYIGSSSLWWDWNTTTKQHAITIYTSSEHRMHTVMITDSFTLDFKHSENLRKKLLNLEFHTVTCLLELFSFYMSRWMKNLQSLLSSIISNLRLIRPNVIQRISNFVTPQQPKIGNMELVISHLISEKALMC